MKLLFHAHFECFFSSLYENILEMGFSFLFETEKLPMSTLQFYCFA